MAINSCSSNGYAVGSLRQINDADKYLPARWNPGVELPEMLEIPSPYSRGEALGVNQNGVVCGFLATESGTQRACVWFCPDNPVLLPASPTFTVVGQALAITEDNEILGVLLDKQKKYRVVNWTFVADGKGESVTGPILVGLDIENKHYPEISLPPLGALEFWVPSKAPAGSIAFSHLLKRDQRWQLHDSVFPDLLPSVESVIGRTQKLVEIGSRSLFLKSRGRGSAEVSAVYLDPEQNKLKDVAPVKRP